MTAQNKEISPVSEQARAFGVRYAKASNFAPKTVSAYQLGKNDETAVVQTLAAFEAELRDDFAKERDALKRQVEVFKSGLATADAERADLRIERDEFRRKYSIAADGIRQIGVRARGFVLGRISQIRDIVAGVEEQI